MPIEPLAPDTTKERDPLLARPDPSDPRARAPLVLFEDETTDQTADGTPGGLEAPIIERGTGRLTGEPASSPADLRRTDDGDLMLNVVDAQISDVVRLVLEDGLDADYIIDPGVSGTITVRTARPMPAEDVVSILSSVLNLNGAALVETDGLYKIVPIGETAAGPLATRRSVAAGGQGPGIMVAPLRYAEASQLAELLQPFIGDQGALQIDVTRNTLLLTGSADQVATMTDLIDIFDVDWMDGMSFGLYPLEAVEPTQLADELGEVFGDPKTSQTEVARSDLRFVPIDRLSAILVITTQPAYLERVAGWIDRLDKEGDGDGEQVYVYAVQNSRAADLASVLGELFDIQSSAVGTEDPFLAPGLEPIELRSLQDLDVDPGSDEISDDRTLLGDRSVFGARDIDPRRGLPTRALTTGDENGTTRIVADETNNALLVRATAKEYQKISSALRELDTQPLQVLLEATIAEVSLEDQLRYGVQWFFGAGNDGVSLSEFGDGSVGSIFPGFSGLLSQGDVRIVLNTLESVSDVKVISSPQILVLDNQTAQLEVGDEVPIVTRQAENIDSDESRIVNTVEQRQTGVILSVTPRVNANGLVVLDIEQEVSDVVNTTTSGIDSPTIAQRRIGTSVAVSSEQTVVLGGLIQDDVEDINSGVPILKDLPILGNLFGATTQITSRTELLVLITPKVLTNQQEAVDATNEVRRRLRNLEPLQAKLRHDG